MVRHIFLSGDWLFKYPYYSRICIRKLDHILTRNRRYMEPKMDPHDLVVCITTLHCFDQLHLAFIPCLGSRGMLNQPHLLAM